MCLEQVFTFKLACRTTDLTIPAFTAKFLTINFYTE